MIPPQLLVALALLSATAPFATDMYLPVLPHIGAEFGASASLVQLTLTGFFVGMAVGQLLSGPLSDALGRKKLLIAGATVALVASVAVAVSGSIWVLIAARVLQGLGGGACVVLSRAIIPDLLEGEAAARAFSLLMAIFSLAPAIAPIIGGLLAGPFGWRGIYWGLVVLHLLQLVLAVAVVPSTGGGRRSGNLMRSVASNFLSVLRIRRFWGFQAGVAFGFSAMFCYIAASPFVFQDRFGFSPLQYSWFFAVNAFGLFLASMLNSRLVGRFGPAVMLRVGVTWSLIAASVLLVQVLVGSPVWGIAASVFFCVAPIGFITGNSAALATGLDRTLAGSITAVMGFTQSMCAGVVSPAMGLGSDMLLTMAVGMVVCTVVSLAGAYWATAARWSDA